MGMQRFYSLLSGSSVPSIGFWSFEGEKKTELDQLRQLLIGEKQSNEQSQNEETNEIQNNVGFLPGVGFFPEYSQVCSSIPGIFFLS